MIINLGSGGADKAKSVKYDNSVSKLSATDTQGAIDEVVGKVNDKVDKVEGKDLSTNDYTTDEKNKLAGIATGANKTTVDTSLSTSSTNPVQNKVVASALNGKVSAVSGKGLSTNDYTNDEKQKLSGIATGATKNVIDSSLSTSSTNAVQNKVVTAKLNTLTSNLGGLRFGKDGDGNYGYYGADDSLIPFKLIGLSENQMLKNGVISNIVDNTFTVERNALNFCAIFIPLKEVRTITTKQSNMNTTVNVWYKDGTSETKTHVSATTLTATQEIALAMVFTINGTIDSRVCTITLS